MKVKGALTAFTTFVFQVFVLPLLVVPCFPSSFVVRGSLACHKAVPLIRWIWEVRLGIYNPGLAKVLQVAYQIG